MQELWRQLPCRMVVGLLAVSLKGVERAAFERVTHHRGEASGADTDACAGEILLEQMLTCRAAADIACADNQYVLEHADHRCIE